MWLGLGGTKKVAGKVQEKMGGKLKQKSPIQGGSKTTERRTGKLRKKARCQPNRKGQGGREKSAGFCTTKAEFRKEENRRKTNVLKGTR